jgi:hypothetical protein
MTNLSVINYVIVATGAATVTTNMASYFDEYQSMFTVGISAITCLGFITSIAWSMWIKWDERKYRRNKDRENEST